MSPHVGQVHGRLALHLSGVEDAGSQGVLTVYDPAHLVEMRQRALEIATTNACFGASAVMVAEAKKVALTDLTIPEQRRTKTALDSTLATKKVCLGLADPAKMVVIGDNLREK
jgi:hypothetical protein